MSRMLHLVATFLIAVAFVDVSVAADSSTPVEKWGIFEAAFSGPKDGNPFVEVSFSATFKQGEKTKQVSGFYDGNGTYRVRFMPETTGRWEYVTSSNRPELNGKSGAIEVTEPTGPNHGPVCVRHAYHFGYADGKPFFPIGTTCYAWIELGDKIEAQTLATLKRAPFNKLRMCILPKWYAYNKAEPLLYPFVGKAPKSWDFTRFDPAFFRHIEACVASLRDLGIEADLILFHPYDKGHWGFDQMPAEVDDRYVRYVVARFGAFRNVWWSLANEFDFMKEKQDADWLRILKLVASSDPYHHLLSIHNGTRLFNHTNPLITHASIQNGSAVADFGRALLYRDVYEKPIVFDEVKYEGNLEQRWGNLAPEELVHRFWQATIAGTYATHGETYMSSDDMIWWSKGGSLRGKSPDRIAFLRKVIESGPATGLNPIDKWQDDRTAGKPGEYYLIYFGKEKPTAWPVELPLAGVKQPLRLKVEILDTWNMTTTPVAGEFVVTPIDRYRLAAQPGTTIPLPGKPYLALRIRATPQPLSK
jgi:hypothetical protein